MPVNRSIINYQLANSTCRKVPHHLISTKYNFTR